MDAAAVLVLSRAVIGGCSWSMCKTTELFISQGTEVREMIVEVAKKSAFTLVVVKKAHQLTDSFCHSS